MNFHYTRALVALLVLGTAVVAGCSSAQTTSAESGYGTPGGGDTSGPGAAYGGGGGSSAGIGAPSDGTSSGGTGAGATTQSGQLTAGVWDDNLNYDFFGAYMAKAAGPGGAMFSQAERDAAHARAIAPATAKTELDVAIVLDTTSSMSDEIKYLQAEFDSIATTLKTKFPQVTPRFGLVVYRDHTDAYLTQAFPFTSDAQAFRNSLAAQSADGGGDQPEAVPEGLAEGVALGWRADANVARVMFWVADAPQHPGEEQLVHGTVNDAVQKGIHVYPVGASGVDEAAELSMRSAAQMTGGRYLFLTDDSGIGNAHAEPHIPCYSVTKLQGAMVRMVESEMLGRRAEPQPTEVLRTVGSPVDGKCTLADQSQVVLY